MASSGVNNYNFNSHLFIGKHRVSHHKLCILFVLHQFINQKTVIFGAHNLILCWLVMELAIGIVVIFINQTNTVIKFQKLSIVTHICHRNFSTYSSIEILDLTRFHIFLGP